MGPKKTGVTKRSLRSVEFGSDKRPKRIVQVKAVDDSVGLSRQEEQELNKALYASLNETRRSKSLPSLTGLENTDFSIRVSSYGSSGSSSRSTSITEKPSSSKADSMATLGKRRSLRGGGPALTKRLFRSDSTGSSENENLNIDESSKDSVKSSSSSANGSKKKIHAQRKFAQGCSLPGTPTSSPAKASATPVKLLSRTPKTEDFLTFLCLRGSSALPSHLDFFNFSREELPMRDDNPKTSSPGRRKRMLHESCIDENSSTSSGANEEVATTIGEKPASTEKSRVSQSKRSAARACAGTYETARGIVSLRQGLQRKVSSSSSSSSSSPRMCRSSPSCLMPASRHTTNKNNSPYFHKPKYYFMPQKSSSLPSEASGVLPGEFTPPSKMCRMGKHSPLIYRPSPSSLASPASPSWSSSANRSPSFSPIPQQLAATTGASKRKRRSSSSFFSSNSGSCQTSSLGAFTPVRSPASTCDSPSSHKRSGSSSRKHFQEARSTVEVLKSARKNLLGKLTSVAKQSEKASVKAKKRLQVSNRSIRLQKGDKSLSRGIVVKRRGLRERKGKRKEVNNDDEDNDDDYDEEKEEEESDDENFSKVKNKTSRRSSSKNLKSRGKSKRGLQRVTKKSFKMVRSQRRRVSERLKVLLQSPHRRRRLISEDEEEELGLEPRVKVKKESETSGGKSTTSTSSTITKANTIANSPSKRQKNQQQKRHNTTEGPKAKAKRPFKIRPPERVRTRGYSSMIASKIALKKAKSRDAGLIRRDRDEEMKAEDSRSKVDYGLKNLPTSSNSSSTGSSSNSNSSGSTSSQNQSFHSSSVTKKESHGSGEKVRRLSSSHHTQQQEGSSDKQREGESTVKPTRGTTTMMTTTITQDVKEAKVKTTGGNGTWSPKLTHAKRVKSTTPTSRPSSASSSPSLSSSRQSSTPHSSSHITTTSSSSSSSSSSTKPHHDSIPIFRPSESDFSDPMAYIAKIQPEAESYGMCKVIPPASWKLDSSRINEDIRFTPQVQYIHRLFNRWGPNVQRTAAINYHLLSELSANTAPPQIGGVEIDLPQLYALVEEAGGLSKMADKKQWASVADSMNIPKQAMDRTMRLYDIYCRHVLPYATLSNKERNELEEEVKAIHELQTLEDEAITRGKSMSVSCFCKIARNIQAMRFKEDPTPDQVESKYWHIVEEGDQHISVQCGHINTLTQASAFPTRKDHPYSKHPWNLNRIPNHEQSVLKYLGPVAGTTIPTMHLGMLFSTSCWSNDPHGLPYIQYHHSGADIIWYCIPKSQRSKFRSAMMEEASSLISNKPRWLKEDCVMVNPTLLRERGLKVGRCVHSPREFVIVFPGAHTATISCGYSMSESVHYATKKWLPFGMDTATALTKSGEKELFAMSSLLCGLAEDKDIDLPTLTDALPLLSSVIYKELDLRTQLHAAGLRSDKKMLSPDSPLAGQSGGSSSGSGGGGGASKNRLSLAEEEKTCEVCSRICHLSMVYVEQEEQILCLEHGLRHIQKRKNSKSTRLFVLYNQPELESILKGAKDQLVVLSSPKASTSSSDVGSGVGASKTRGGTVK